MERRHSFSGLFQVDAAAGVEEDDEAGGGGVQMRRCVVRKRKVEDEKAEGESEKGPLVLFIRLEG